MEEFRSFVFNTYSVAVSVVLVTILVAVWRSYRKREERRIQARLHFVKAATLFGDAQKTKTGRETQNLAQQAILEVDIAIKLDTSDPSFHMLKSLALEVVGNSGGAVKELDRALARPKSLTIPERSVTLIKKAELLLSQSEEGGNHIQEAREDLCRSVALTPTNPRAQLLLGEVYEKEGNIPKAIEAFNQAALLDPRSPDAKRALERLQV